MGECVLYTLLNLSDDKNNNDGLPTEMAGWVKEKIEAFVVSPYSDMELYDFLDSVARIPIERFGGGCVGDISGFIQAACDVKKCYDRPEDGDKKFLDKEECRKKLEKR
jgi:hypothetical protein